MATLTIPIAHPRPGMVYAEVSVRPTAPDGIRFYQSIGYRVVAAKEAPELLDEAFLRPVSEGGFVDKTNNCITNTDVLIMEATADCRNKFHAERAAGILRQKAQVEAASAEDADKALFDLNKGR